MTPVEWDQCEDARAMLHFLGIKSGERKTRLLACACARSRSPKAAEEGYRRVIETAERYADGLAEKADLWAACEDMWYLGWKQKDSDAHAAAEATVQDFAGDAATRAISCTADAASLVREVFGNPFRSTHFDADWAQDIGGRVRDFARKIYDDDRFEDLWRLADLAVVSGCRNGEVLAHLRSSGPHFRGCWALDVILGQGAGKDLVTEKEWLTETHPLSMLTWWEYLRGKPSARKRRLVACACCRLIWPLLVDARVHRAVEVAEAFADGLATADDMAEAGEAARAQSLAQGEILGKSRSHMPGRGALEDLWRAASAAASASHLSLGMLGNTCHYAAAEPNGRNTKDPGQANVIRDVLGNPLRQAVLNSASLHRDDGMVQRIAQGIYDGRTFARMPILGDALSDAGCADEEVLSHCREPGEHVRGCWLLDLVLENE